MATPEEQIIAAIQIASDPRGSSQELQNEAVSFLTKVRRESSESWRPALSLFVATNEEGVHRWPADVRLFALNILLDFLDIRHSKGNLDDDVFTTLRDAFLTYMQREYLYGSAESATPFLRNKFSQTLCLFFLATYETKAPDFFNYFIFSLLKPPPEAGVPPFNAHVSIFFFRLLIEISSEVADQLLKNARYYDPERVARDGRIRDLIRDKDALAINQAVLTIISDSKQKLDELRTNGESSSERSTLLQEVISVGARAFASYVPWIDISLTVTPDTIPLIFSLLSDPATSIRLVSCAILSSILSKGLKVPGDKLQLIQVLSLTVVLDQLEASTRNGPGAQEEDSEGSFREALGKVANSLGVELVALCSDTKLPPSEVATASQLLEELIPIVMRFFSDPYDDVSLTVFPLITEVLSNYKKAKAASPQTHMTLEKQTFLESLLKMVIEKLKWDADEQPDDMDPDEKLEFEGLRKDLRRFIDAVIILDPDIVTQGISERASEALSAYEGSSQLPWVDAELAIYLVFLYGELGNRDKSVQGRAAFAIAPRNIPKAERKTIDYEQFPLTPQGEMMQLLIRSGISKYPHPTVAMQFFETVTRYADFFKVRKEWVLPALQAFLDTRGVHHPLPGVRKRVFYLFFRFVQQLRIDINIDHIPPILQAIQDLLIVDVEVPSDYEPPSPQTFNLLAQDQNQSFLSDILQIPTIFDSQLHLFEAAGALISALWSSPEPQATALQTIMTPILAQLQATLNAVASYKMSGDVEQDAVPILTIHHIIRALGSIPKGFPEYPNPTPPDYIQPPLAEFQQMSEAVLLSLDVVGRFKVLREAARFAFGRIIYAAGPSMTTYIPRLMTSLLAHFDPSELVDFVAFLAHMTHKLGVQLQDVVDQVFWPLTNHVSNLLSAPVSGTDDKVARQDTSKGYLSFLNTILTSNIGAIFVSTRNLPNLGQFLETLLQVSADCSDPLNQKLALIFLAKFITTFGTTQQQQEQQLQANGTGQKHPGAAVPQVEVPGMEQFIYQRVLLVAFSIPSLPEFNIKDAQAVVVLGEIGNLLQVIMKARGQKAFDYMYNMFLPSQNCPPEAAMNLVTSMRDLDNKGFKKYFSDFVKSSRS